MKILFKKKKAHQHQTLRNPEYGILGEKLSANRWMNDHSIILHSIYLFPKAMQCTPNSFLWEVTHSEPCDEREDCLPSVLPALPIECRKKVFLVLFWFCGFFPPQKLAVMLKTLKFLFSVPGTAEAGLFVCSLLRLSRKWSNQEDLTEPSCPCSGRDYGVLPGSVLRSGL